MLLLLDNQVLSARRYSSTYKPIRIIPKEAQQEQVTVTTPPITPVLSDNNVHTSSKKSTLNNDGFESVRTQITRITRGLQQYHIRELDKSTFIPTSNSSMIRNLGVSSNRPISPLSILYSTDDSLVRSHTLEEYCNKEDEDHTNSTNNEQDQYDVEWENSFMDLMTSIIAHSENLECISTEILRTEGKIRELVSLQKSILCQFEEREKAYTDRLDECDKVYQDQLNLIDNLIELKQDLSITSNKTTDATTYKQKHDTKQSLLIKPDISSTNTHLWQSSEQSQRNNRKTREDASSCNDLSTRVTNHENRDDTKVNIGFKQSAALTSLVRVKSMQDIVHTLRWEVGLRIGGNVGTGHVIHSFGSPLSGRELIVAGSGMTATANKDTHVSSAKTNASAISKSKNNEINETSYVHSPSIQYLHFQKHHYMLYITSHDRETRFRLLPKRQWIPDNQAVQCQFKSNNRTCLTLFSLFQRKHHCRRCGEVICQRHSLNRLPLFSGSQVEKWHRVCDTCFCDLIVAKNDAQHQAISLSY